MLFSALGLILWRREFTRLAVFYLLIAYWFILMLGTAPGPRYRLGIEWVLIAFSGAGFTWFYDNLRLRSAEKV